MVWWLSGLWPSTTAWWVVAPECSIRGPGKTAQASSTADKSLIPRVATSCQTPCCCPHELSTIWWPKSCGPFRAPLSKSYWKLTADIWLQPVCRLSQEPARFWRGRARWRSESPATRYGRVGRRRDSRTAQRCAPHIPLEVSSSLIDVALHTAALLREDGLGGLHYCFGVRRRERSELGDHVDVARGIGRWNRPLERPQNPG